MTLKYLQLYGLQACLFLLLVSGGASSGWSIPENPQCSLLFKDTPFRIITNKVGSQAKEFGFINEEQAKWGIEDSKSGPSVSPDLKDRGYVLGQFGVSLLLKLRDYTRTFFAGVDYIIYKATKKESGLILDNPRDIKEIEDFFEQVTRHDKSSILKYSPFNDKEQVRFMIEREKDLVQYLEYIESNLLGRRGLGTIRKILSNTIAEKNSFGEPFHLVFHNVTGLSRLVADPYYENNKASVPGLLYKFDRYNQEVKGWVDTLFSREDQIIARYKEYFIKRAQIRALFLASKHAEMAKDGYLGWSPSILRNWVKVEVPVGYENGKFNFETWTFNSRSQLNEAIDGLRGELGIHWLPRARRAGFNSLKYCMREHVEKPYAYVHRKLMVYYNELKEVKASGELSGDRLRIYELLRDNLFEAKYYPTLGGIMHVAFEIGVTQAKHWSGKITEYPKETIQFFDYLAQYGSRPMKGISYVPKDPPALLKLWGQMEGYFAYRIKRYIFMGVLGFASVGGLQQAYDYTRPAFRAIEFNTDVSVPFIGSFMTWVDKRGIMNEADYNRFREKGLYYLRSKHNIPDWEVVFTGEGFNAKSELAYSMENLPFVGGYVEKAGQFYESSFKENPGVRTQTYNQIVGQKYPQMLEDWSKMVLDWYIKHQPEKIPTAFTEVLRANEFENWFYEKTFQIIQSAYEVEMGFRMGRSSNVPILKENILRGYSHILKSVYTEAQYERFLDWVESVRHDSNHEMGFSVEPPLPKNPRLAVVFEGVSIYLKLEASRGPGALSQLGPGWMTKEEIEKLKFNLFIDRIESKTSH